MKKLMAGVLTVGILFTGGIIGQAAEVKENNGNHFGQMKQEQREQQGLQEKLQAKVDEYGAPMEITVSNDGVYVKQNYSASYDWTKFGMYELSEYIKVCVGIPTHQNVEVTEEEITSTYSLWFFRIYDYKTLDSLKNPIEQLNQNLIDNNQTERVTSVTVNQVNDSTKEVTIIFDQNTINHYPNYNLEFTNMIGQLYVHEDGYHWTHFGLIGEYQNYYGMKLTYVKK